MVEGLKCSETNLTVQPTKLRKAGLGSSRTSICLGKCERHDDISQLLLCFLIHLKTQIAKRQLRYCAYSLQPIFSLGTRFLGRLKQDFSVECCCCPFYMWVVILRFPWIYSLPFVILICFYSNSISWKQGLLFWNLWAKWSFKREDLAKCRGYGSI